VRTEDQSAVPAMEGKRSAIVSGLLLSGRWYVYSDEAGEPLH
jgi:hypothetical protein